MCGSNFNHGILLCDLSLAVGSQRKLASALNVSEPTLTSWKHRGIAKKRLPQIMRLASLYGVKVDLTGVIEGENQ